MQNSCLQQSMEMKSVLIVGDIAPNGRLRNFNNDVFCSVIETIRSCDYSLFNLESPIVKSDNSEKNKKQGPCLRGKIDILEILGGVGFTCSTLANNHIYDYCEKGLTDTKNGLKAYDIDYLGAGFNLKESATILYKKFSSINVAFINCCEHEFSIASEFHGGANPLNPITQYYQIKEAKQKADFVIMILHGGVEHFQYPTKRMVQTYRYFIDAGADAVINHHQHCPCGYEIYNGKPIYYGIGNFCFDWEGKRNSIWNLGYMVRLNMTSDHQISSEIIPYRQCDETPTVSLLEGDELHEFNLMMKALCLVIQDEKLLDNKFKEFNVKNDYLYRKMFEPYSGRIMNGLYRRGLLPTCMSKERILALMDFIVCESHYERVKEYLNRTYNLLFNE